MFCRDYYNDVFFGTCDIANCDVPQPVEQRRDKRRENERGQQKRRENGFELWRDVSEVHALRFQCDLLRKYLYIIIELVVMFAFVS